MNTTKFKRNNLEQLRKFNVGDKIAIHNGLTGSLSFSGKIVYMAEACIKYGQPIRYAGIELDNGNIICNYLGTAILIN